MRVEKRFGKRKKSNPLKGLILVLLLAVVLFLISNMDSFLTQLFN